MSRMLGHYARLTSRLSDVAAHFAMLAIVLMAGHILLEIILRAFWSTSTFVMDEFVGYEVAAMTFLGLGAALAQTLAAPAATPGAVRPSTLIKDPPTAVKPLNDPLLRY